MERAYRHINVQRHNDVFCVRLRSRQLMETEILELADELVSLIIDGGCRKLVLSLGPEKLDCLYSVFLAKLVMLRRRMRECGGVLKLCEVPPEVVNLFEATHLKDFFEFVKDQPTAIALLSQH
jgi:anti-sigma B factor antagonist